jgi:hypothetical protein
MLRPLCFPEAWESRSLHYAGFAAPVEMTSLLEAS